MEPGLYVLVPVGLGGAEGELASPIPLIDGVELASFDPAWKDEVRHLLELVRKDHSDCSDHDLEQFEKTRHCLILRFGDPDGGRPIEPEVYDQGELDIRARARPTYGLAKRWLRSLGVLVIAGRIHFGCFPHWFGFRAGQSPELPLNCYKAIKVGWYGRFVDDEKREAADDEYRRRVGMIVRTLARCPDESRPAVAADMFARAEFADDWRVAMLFYWVALEALFGQAEAELSHQLCERAAVLITSPGEDRLKVYRGLRDAYGFRSKLVHGGLRHPMDQDRQRLSAVIDLVEDGARRALCRVLTDRDMTKLFLQKDRAIKDYFEKAVLTPHWACHA